LKCWCRGDEASSRVAASLIFDMNELAVDDQTIVAL
jgi:hypothetical protein